VTVSRGGLVKKSSLHDLPGPSTQLFTLARVNPGDEIGWAVLTDGKSELMLATQKGMVIRFTEEDVRPMGLVAAGVNGIKLAAKDQVMGAARIVPEFDLLLVGRDGKAWRLPTAQLPVQGRYGQGAIACKPSAGGELIGMVYSHPGQEIIVEMKEGASKVETIAGLPAGRRQSTPKVFAAVKPGDQVTGLTMIEDGLAYWEKRQGAALKKTRRVTAPEPRVDQLALPLDGQPKRTRSAEKPAAKKTAPAKAVPPRAKVTAAKPAVKPKPTRTASSTAVKKTAAKSAATKISAKAPAKPISSAVKTLKPAVKPVKAPAKPAAKTSTAVEKKTAAAGKASSSSKPTLKTAATPTTKSITKPAAKPSAAKPASATRKPAVKNPAKGSTKPAAKKPAAGKPKTAVKPVKTPVKKPKSGTK